VIHTWLLFCAACAVLVATPRRGPKRALAVVFAALAARFAFDER
jgi:hypothetical protein